MILRRRHVFNVIFLTVLLRLSDSSCPEPAPVAHAYRTLDTDKVTYTCYHGYVLTAGDLNRTCTDSGVYDGQPPECSLDCGPPDLATDMNVTYNSTLGWSVAIVTCDETHVPELRFGETVTVLCNPFMGRWDTPVSMCRGLIDTGAVSSSDGSSDANLAVDGDTSTCYYFPSVSSWWSVSFLNTSLLYDVLRIWVQVKDRFEVTAVIDGGPVAECDTHLLVRNEVNRLICAYAYQPTPFGTGMTLYANTMSGTGTLRLCEVDILGRVHSGLCTAPSAIPHMMIKGGHSAVYKIGNAVTYACASGFHSLGGNSTSVCQFTRKWSHPTLLCTGETNHAFGAAGDLYAPTRHVKSLPNSVFFYDDELTQERMILPYGYNRTIRARMSQPLEVSKIVVDIELRPDYQLPDTTPLPVYIEASVLTSADNSTSHRCGNHVTDSTGILVIECPYMPVGQAVDVTVRRDFDVDGQILFNEMKVFGRPFDTPLECLQSASGVEYKGRLSVSRTGVPCLRWDSLSHTTSGTLFALDNLTFPDRSISDASNFCRNPGGIARRPYCHKAPTWVEFCSLELCDKFCRHGDGQHYDGEVSMTASGHDCLSWLNESIPIHLRFSRREDFSQEIIDTNFCRNPAASFSSPWCYYDDGQGHVKHGVCDLPTCPKSVTYLLERDLAVASLTTHEPCYNDLLPPAFADYASTSDEQRAKCDLTSDLWPVFYCYTAGQMFVVTSYCNETNETSSTIDVETSFVTPTTLGDFATTGLPPLDQSSTIRDHSDSSVQLVSSVLRSSEGEASSFSLSEITDVPTSGVVAVMTSLTEMTSTDDVRSAVEATPVFVTSLDVAWDTQQNIQPAITTSSSEGLYSSETVSYFPATVEMSTTSSPDEASESTVKHSAEATLDSAPQITDTSTSIPQTTEAAAPIPQTTETTAPVPKTADTAAPMPITTETAASTLQTTKTAAPIPQTTETAAPVPQTTETVTPITQTTETAAPIPQTTETSAPVLQTTETAAPTSETSAQIASTTTPEGSSVAFETTSETTSAETTTGKMTSPETTIETAEGVTSTNNGVDENPTTTTTNNTATNETTTTANSEATVRPISTISPKATKNIKCPCSCKAKASLTSSQDPAQLENSIKQMQNELLVDKSSLSKTIREKISIYDDTPSSASLGVLAIVFMAVMMVFIIANDAIRVTQFLMGVIRGPGTRIGNHEKIDG